MMKSILLVDSDDTDPDWSYVEGYNAPQTPSTISDQPGGDSDAGPQRYDSDDDDEYGGSTQVATKRKKGGYDSRIEQILYENPEIPILIVDAGKSAESGGKYIVYTIKTGVRKMSLVYCGLDADSRRILRFEEDTLNLPLSEMPLPGYTLP
jgi:hypothetical protein